MTIGKRVRSRCVGAKEPLSAPVTHFVGSCGLVSPRPRVRGLTRGYTPPSLRDSNARTDTHSYFSVCSVGVQPDILSLKLGSSTLNQVTNEDSNEMIPVWSPDGKRIAYYSNKSGAYQVWTINPDGSGAQQITEVAAPGAVIPVFSPDGSHMAYSLFGGKSFIMDLRRPWTEQTPFETPSNDSIFHFVAHSWSSDGKDLCGSGYRISNIGVFIYSLETQHYEMISDFGLESKFLSDNKRVIFCFEDKVYVADAQSKKPRELFSFAPDTVSYFDISKDNRSIYVSVASPRTDIWLLSIE